jgi:hypothetical protein
MLIKTVFGLAVLMIVSAMGWRYMGPGLAKPSAVVAPLPAVISFENTPTAAQATPPRTQAVEDRPPGTVRGVRKCKKGSSVIYTDQLCPKGMQDLRVVERELTVLPRTPAPQSVKSPLPPDGQNEPSIRAKQMERVINQ